MEEKNRGIVEDPAPGLLKRGDIFVVCNRGAWRNSKGRCGVGSIMRALALAPETYPCLVNFFHSSAWGKNRLLLLWAGLLFREGLGWEINGRTVLVADHTKQPKDVRKMPDVRTMRQNSETSSKPSYFRGHDWGFVAMVSCRMAKFVAIPVWGEIHRDSEDESRSVRLLGKVLEISSSLGKSFYLVLDAFFSVGPVMLMAMKSGGLVHVLVRAKKNVTAYEVPAEARKRKRGKPRKYGRKKKLIRLFETKSSAFEHADILVYQKLETVRFMTLDLMWKPVKEKIRFFLVETST